MPRRKANFGGISTTAYRLPPNGLFAECPLKKRFVPGIVWGAGLRLCAARGWFDFLDDTGHLKLDLGFKRRIVGPPCRDDTDRSEEHTSELQSLRHLVCRLLLEKKK